MRTLLNRFLRSGRTTFEEKTTGAEQLKRQVSALFGVLSELYGADKLVLKAGKLDALNLMRSPDLRERVLALEKLVYEDPTLEEVPDPEAIPEVLNEIEDELADALARRQVEDKLEKKVAERMQKRHEEYVQEIRAQILREDAGPDNAQTLKKYAELEKLEQRRLSRSALEVLRPSSVAEVVGQDRAIKALFAKIASPFPQHVILYGPPGVGKTTVARLALETAKKLPFTPFAPDARFVEVDGATLRWDPREVANPLLGSVHDPIYQGARRDLAETGIPEPKPGLVTEAHGGVLFIDEIGELDLMLQNKLLKVLEDKRVTFDSAYYDPADPNVPKYIRKLFEEGAPADFILIGATTRDPSEINPALRSRCAEIFFEPLDQADIRLIVKNAARKLGVALEDGLPELISEYTIEGRKATNVLADAYGMALHRMLASQALDVSTREDGVAGAPAADGAAASIESAAPTGGGGVAPKGIVISRQDVLEVIQTSRLTPYLTVKASPRAEVGHVFGLGVWGFVGSVIEIEAVAFPAREPGRGTIRFNDTAGSMAKDSVFNAASMVRRLTGKDLANFDVHVNVVGGGRIDGPSAGVAILIAILSALEGWPVYQDVAITGELSIQGRVKGVGGIPEKLYGARQAGMRLVIIPAENRAEAPVDLGKTEVLAVESVDEVLGWVFAGWTQAKKECPIHLAG